MSTAAELGLVARTRTVPGGPDLLEEVGPDDFVWLRDGVGFVASGVAATVPAREVAEFLDRIVVDDEVDASGTGAIAVGALPFDPGEPAALVVPARVIGRTVDGRTWITEIGPFGERGHEGSAPPAHLERVGGTTVDEWRHAVGVALDAIALGQVDKVVLARDLTLRADAPFDVAAVLGRLCEQQAGTYIYAHRGLVGASPELLVRRRAGVASSTPMAGTARGTDPASIDALTNSAKDAREHRLVVEAVLAALEPHTDSAPEVRGPEVVALPNLVHLVTRVDVKLRADAPNALDLARALHPTPAVGGSPTAPALALIAALEPRGRDRYAGPVGWVDATGDGEFAIALRGATIDGAEARCFAGCGIVAGSDPEAEWAESERKLAPMLRALGAD
ncbi:MAG: isochorismate synthase MenF [Actinomycetes bacterium]